MINKEVLNWWNNLGENALLTLIKQGELTEKHYGQRIPKSLSIEEIAKIYLIETSGDKPQFYQLVLQPIALEDVISHVYPNIKKGAITLDDRLPINCKCDECGHNKWMIHPTEIKDTLNGGKTYIDCMNCGRHTHL